MGIPLETPSLLSLYETSTMASILILRYPKARSRLSIPVAGRLRLSNDGFLDHIRWPSHGVQSRSLCYEWMAPGLGDSRCLSSLHCILAMALARTMKPLLGWLIFVGWVRFATWFIE